MSAFYAQRPHLRPDGLASARLPLHFTRHSGWVTLDEHTLSTHHCSNAWTTNVDAAAIAAAD